MLGHFFQRRQIWWPTLPGWIAVLLLGLAPILAWWFKGEDFLAVTDRQPAEVLVVEGWIGLEGVRAAKTEFEQGGYRLLMAVGASTNSRWGRRQWNYAELAHDELVRLGVPADQVVAVPSKDAGRQRTFQSAVAVRDVLRSRRLVPRAVNVFTLDVHTRRSRLVFDKVLASETSIGAISWRPAVYGPGPWWTTSERASDMLKETVGYFYELILNSGRFSNTYSYAGTPFEPTSEKKEIYHIMLNNNELYHVSPSANPFLFYSFRNQAFVV